MIFASLLVDVVILVIFVKILGTVRDIFAGPYLEGNNVHLSCRVVGGKPPPRVVWYKNHQIISEQFIQVYNRFVILVGPSDTMT